MAEDEVISVQEWDLRESINPEAIDTQEVAGEIYRQGREMLETEEFESGDPGLVVVVENTLSALKLGIELDPERGTDSEDYMIAEEYSKYPGKYRIARRKELNAEIEEGLATADIVKAAIDSSDYEPLAELTGDDRFRDSGQSLKFELMEEARNLRDQALLEVMNRQDRRHTLHINFESYFRTLDQMSS
jgi:hypothetical protein